MHVGKKASLESLSIGFYLLCCLSREYLEGLENLQLLTDSFCVHGESFLAWLLLSLG